MQSSLYTAVSGVKGHQTYLDVTGHNISNVNTVGYKRDTIQFADMISQTLREPSAPEPALGGVNIAQSGLGVSLASISQCFAQGSMQTTEIPTDMAINGDGFFVVSDGGRRLYTRAGNFALDRDGNLVMQGSGYMAQGYKIDGVSQAGELSAITIPVGDVMPPRATGTAAFRCNLDSGSAARVPDLAAVPTGADAVPRPFDYAGAADVAASASSASGDAVMDAFGESMAKSHDWSDSFVVYDEAGNPSVMTVMFRKVFDRPADPSAVPPTAAETEWDWYAYRADENGNVDPQYGRGGGTLVFGDDGRLERTYAFDQSNGWAAVVKDITDGADDGRPTGLVGGIRLDFLGRDYAASTGLPFDGALDGVTSFGSPSTTKMKGQDGYERGVMNDWSVSGDGLIVGSYSNGQTRPLARVALARFVNPQGLDQAGGACFAETPNSGAARILAPGERGAGTIKGGMVEMSNVDLSEEFVSLIRSQRGLQANTRAITTSDRMLEVLINLKR